MELPIISFIIGIVFLLFSTRLFIRFAEHLSVSLKLSPLIIGLTVVSIGTSLPELSVSMVAGLRGDAGLAMGNIIGSNIVNVFLVFGIGILSGKILVGEAKTQRNIFLMTGITALFLLLYLFRISHVIAGGILLFAALTVTYLEYKLGVKGRKHEDAGIFKRQKKSKLTHRDFGALIASLIGVVTGGLLTVTSVEHISVLMGFSTTILGLSITAIATSLPELLTTILSERDQKDKISIGDLIGSNIYNLTLISGVVLLSSTWQPVTLYELCMFVAATVVFFGVIVVNKGKVIPKYTGFLLLVMFVVYIYFLR